MSQSTSVVQSTSVPTVEERVHQARACLSRGLSGTPGRLRIVALCTVSFCLIFASGTFSAFQSADGALSRGRANVTQLVRIQAIHTDLLRADADATNAFLIGRLESPAQRASYLASMGQASTLIVQAATAQPADGPALGALNSSVLTYAGLIGQARANNRQALPMGAEYLQLASSRLRTDALPILDALVTANNARVGAEFDDATGASSALVTRGVLALLVLIGAMVWLSRRTHRYINVPLAAAAGAILVTLVLGAVVLASVSSRVSTVRDGSYAATLATAKARIAAYDAKSNESLTLIAHGSGTAFQHKWASMSDIVTTQSAAAARLNTDAASMSELWTKYVNAHVQIRKADSRGQWESAVNQAIGSGPASANATFDAFDANSAAALTSSSQSASNTLNAPHIWLLIAAWLGGFIGITAAISAWWGVSLRLEEYR